MWNAGESLGAEGIDVREGNASRLADHPTQEEVTRQVPVEIEESGSVRGDTPEESCQQDIFHARENESNQLHVDLRQPIPRERIVRLDTGGAE